MAECFSAVVAYGFDGAAEERLFAKRGLGLCFGLFEDEGIAAAVVAREVRRRGVAAHVAVYAVRVHVVCAGCVFGDAVVRVSHKKVLSVECRMIRSRARLYLITRHTSLDREHTVERDARPARRLFGHGDTVDDAALDERGEHPREVP